MRQIAIATIIGTLVGAAVFMLLNRREHGQQPRSAIQEMDVVTADGRLYLLRAPDPNSAEGRQGDIWSVRVRSADGEMWFDSIMMAVPVTTTVIDHRDNKDWRDQ